MAPEVEARILELRRAHPGWGPRTIGHRLERDGVEPVPGRSSIYRCLVRHGLITPQARRKRRSDYKRWERSRAMELWQMDIVGGVILSGGREAKIVTGVDDHSRFCVSAHVVARATAQPTCDALGLAMRRHGVPEQILTDNGKVFTGRFGPGTGEVLFDRICRENGIKHLLTAPRSPTTTGKVERFHKTLRAEFLTGKVFASIEDAQAALDAWVAIYNTERPHQSIGMVAPIERFRLADRKPLEAEPTAAPEPPTPTEPAPQPRQAGRRPTPGRPKAAARSADGHRGLGHSQGRLLGQRLLRRGQLPGRQPVPPPPGPGRSGRRHGRDLHRQRTHPHVPGQARPHPRARGPGQPRW